MKRVVGSLLILLALHLTGHDDAARLQDRLALVNGKEKVKVLIELIDTLGYNAPRRVIAYGRQALELLENSPDPSLELQVLNDMCWNYHILGNYKEALSYADRGIKIAEARDLKEELSRLYNKIAVIYWKSSDYSQALAYHRKAIKINKEGSRQRLAHSYNNIALVHMELGEYEKALDYLLKAQEINEEFAEKLRISQALLNNIGWVHHHLKEYQKALAYYSRALEIGEEAGGGKHGRANVLTDMGDTYTELNDFNRALTCYQSAQKLYEELEEKRGIAKTLNKMGSISSHQAQYDPALAYYSRALAINEELGDKQAMAAAIVNIANAYKSQGKYRQALARANRALALAEEIKAKRLIGDTLKEISEIYAGMESFDKALDYYRRYHENHDSIFNEESNKKIAEMQIRFETDKKEKEIELLKREGEIQGLALSKQRNIRNFLIVVCLLVLLLAAVAYYSYRTKARTNLKLQDEIFGHQLTEAKLLESEAKFRTLAEKSQIGIYIVQHNRFKYVNPKFAEIFGYSAKEIMKKKRPADLTGEKEWPPSTKADLSSAQFKGIKKEGELIFLESLASPITFEGKEALLGTILDVTDRQRMERERLKNRNLESIGVLAGGIAHDFNNLLSVIMGNLFLAKSHLQPQKKNLSWLDRAEDASSQAATLTEKLLTFSTGDILVKGKVDLVQIVQRAIDLALRDARISYHQRIPDSLMPIYGDERQLVQVFSNLFQNAGDAMPAGGILFIKAENSTLEPANEFELAAGKFVHISIADTGAGIPEENLGQIFDPYFSTRDRTGQKGTGMGLTVCYSIVRKHQGHISVKSEYGKGTVVDLYLPAFLPEIPVTEEKEVFPIAAEPAAVGKQKANILFMDDEESINVINREMLEMMGYDVVCCREGSEAVAAYKQARMSGSPFDIVVLDIINYIGLGGKETLAQIMAFDPEVKSIAISGYLRNTDIQNLKKIGFDEVIFKPYNPTDLEKAINNLMPVDHEETEPAH